MNICHDCGSSYTSGYTNALGHVWDEGKIVSEATCATGGVTEHACERCGATRLETAAVSPSAARTAEHDFDAVVTAPTCESMGYTTYTCGDCGLSYKSDYVEKTAHDYEAEVTAPTCTKMGYTTYACDDCDAGYTGDYTDALGHDHEPTVTAPGCLTAGYTTYECPRCGDSYVSDHTDALGHEWDDGTEVTSSTCNGGGVTSYKCLRCDALRLEALSAEGHTPGAEATCTAPQLCTDCGAVLQEALGHDYEAEVTAPTCTELGYTAYTCANCGGSYRSDYVLPLGHDHEPTVTAPGCLTAGYTTYECPRCGDSYVSDHTDALGHDWDEGTEVTGSTCNGEGMKEYRCLRCDVIRLEALSAEGHTPGAEATCTAPRLCTDCGAVLANATGHSYEQKITAPTCEEMGFTTHTCTRCGDSYTDAYTDPAGHKPGDWIVDREPTTTSEGSRHIECESCGETLETAVIEKVYMLATTDTRGEALVGDLLVIVTDTDSKNPVSNAAVALNSDGSISVLLPDNRLLDYADQTTITVLLAEDKAAVEGMALDVSDHNGNYCEGQTDKAGQLTVPGTKSTTGNDGGATAGFEDADGSRFTLTVKVADYETGRPIDGAAVSVGRTGSITVTLPDGVDMDENNRILITVTDNEKNPQFDKTVIVKNDLGNSETGQTDEMGVLIVPPIDSDIDARSMPEYHGAYIFGYPDGTFGPEKHMTRAEAASIFARLLAEKNGEVIETVDASEFSDVPADAWYAGQLAYLSGYGIVYGRDGGVFDPDAPITRAEFTAMAVRFFAAYGGGDAEIMELYRSFDDVSEGYWAAEYIYDAALRGWIVGYGDGTFRAEEHITRAEVVTLMGKLLGRANDGSCIAAGRTVTGFADMSDRHWAYYAVLEATNGAN